MKKNARIKDVLILGVLALMALPLFGNGKQENPRKVRLAIQPDHVSPYVAEQLGYFKDEGLDVELSLFNYGPPIIEALTSNSVDIGLVGDLPAFSALANNVPIKIIGSYTTSDTYNALVVGNNAGIKTLGDLKGKKLSVPFGSNCQPLLYMYLERAGLTENDVEIINLSFGEGITALLAGQIDAAVTSEPNLSRALFTGNATQLATAEGYKLFVSPVIARTDFITKNPELTAKILKALNRGGAWAKEHVSEAAEITAKATDGNANALKLNIEKREWDVALTQRRIDALAAGAGHAFQYGLTTKKVDVTSNIDTSYLKAAGIQ